jgi:hypothetical protein
MTATLLDRVVHWHLDLDGDIYGDERERLRWYEGITTAASLQWLAIPWAAAIMVWPLGRPAVLPLAVVLVALLLPMSLCAVYVRRRHVHTRPPLVLDRATATRHWSRKRLLLCILGGLPFVLFLIGALYVWNPDSPDWQGAAIGGAIGVAGAAASALTAGRRREAAVVGDEE